MLILDPGSGQVHAQHPLKAPGEASILDEHYGGPRLWLAPLNGGVL